MPGYIALLGVFEPGTTVQYNHHQQRYLSMVLNPPPASSQLLLHASYQSTVQFTGSGITLSRGAGVQLGPLMAAPQPRLLPWQAGASRMPTAVDAYGVQQATVSAIVTDFRAPSMQDPKHIHHKICE